MNTSFAVFRCHSPFWATIIIASIGTITAMCVPAAEPASPPKTVTSGPLKFEESLIRDQYGYAYGLSAVDIDRDGDLDLTSADATKDCLYWFENDGKARFTARLIYEKDPKLFERHAAGDIDGDGWPDVAIVKNLAHELLWFQNTRQPRNGKLWTRHRITAGFSRAYDVALGDLDGDGDLDVAASSYQGNQFAWFVNNGKPRDGKPWEKHVIDSGIPDTRTIAVADFNADGRPDLLGSGLAANLVVWYESHGKADNIQWRKHIVDDISFGPCHGHPADMDGDGDFDIIMGLGYAAGGATNTHHAAWYENLGTPGKGREWKKHVIGTHFAAFEAIAVDLDGDKDLDVVATAMGSVGGVVWFENGGDPRKVWKQHPLKPNWTNANQVIAADFDGDGLPDLAGSAERGSNEVLLWRNLGRIKQ